MSGGELLTGRQLVAQLAALDVGTWTPDAVRQWIREEPALPIASPAQQGQPHRYRLDDALAWLEARAQRERAKGYTAADGRALLDRIAGARVRLNGGAGVPVAAPSDAPAMRIAAPGAADAALAADAPATTTAAQAPVAPAQIPGVFSEEEIASLTELDLVLKVLRGRDPRNWESVERAIRLHRENRREAGDLVPVGDLEATLATQALAMRSAATAMVQALAQRIPDQSTLAERVEIIRNAVDAMLTRLSREDTEALAAEVQPA